MTISRSDFSLHAVLCVIAIVLGAAIFFNGIHVQPHQATGLIIAVLGVLLLL